MKFIHITAADDVGSNAEQSRYFRDACTQREIAYQRFVDKEFDLSDLQAIAKDTESIVYRSTSSGRARALETELIQPATKTVYKDNQTAITGKGSSYTLMQKAQLPVIPAIPFLPRRKSEIYNYADHLGGFPLVIKVMGGMEGVGVIRVDSPESFNSVADYIKQDPSIAVIVMQYIPHTYYARLVVVGESVVAATKDQAPVGDFRGNTRGQRKEGGSLFHPSEEMKQVAIAATNTVGVKAAGVDLLLTENDFYIAEVNCPYNFAETQTITGIDIAGAMVDEMLR